MSSLTVNSMLTPLTACANPILNSILFYLNANLCLEEDHVIVVHLRLCVRLSAVCEFEINSAH
jgi:hypothetical protein